MKQGAHKPPKHHECQHGHGQHRPVQTPSDAAAASVYTCPMHLEIRQDRPGNCPLCGMALEPLMPELDDDNPELRDFSRRFWYTLPRTATVLALATAAVIAGFYLLREHWGHVLGYWPYLLLLACPLMHLMHGHGGHGGHGNHAQTPRRTNNDKE